MAGMPNETGPILSREEQETMVHFKPLSILVAVLSFLTVQSVGAVGFPDVPNTHFNAHITTSTQKLATLGAMFTEGNEDFWIKNAIRKRG